MIFLKIIGLCGGSGSGKGEVCRAFSLLGIPSIDTDAVYHEIISHPSDCLRDLAAAFGDDIIKDGALDRKVLASRVFGAKDSPDKCKVLNSITHKYVLDEVRKKLSLLSKRGYVAALVDAPLLFESGFNRECDMVIAVLADTELRIQRIISRDNITAEQAASRIRAQRSDEWLHAHADRIITNNTDIEDLTRQVVEIYKTIINL